MTEESETIDIVALVNNNPLTRLSSNYGSKVLQKIQSKFSSQDQQLFVGNFYCYLNYNQKTDFVINLDQIWKWLGYGRIQECKRVLIKHFEENVDYKVEIYFEQDSAKKTEPIEEQEKLSKVEEAASEDAEAAFKVSEEPEKKETRGRKPEYITLTVNCFKKLCLKSRTEKADQIHDYYIALEEIIHRRFVVICEPNSGHTLK
jgi:hypothetical protein